MSTYRTTVKINKSEAKTGCTKIAEFKESGRNYWVQIPAGTKNGQTISMIDQYTGDTLFVSVKVKASALPAVAAIAGIILVISLIGAVTDNNDPSVDDRYSHSASSSQGVDKTAYADETYRPKEYDYYNQLDDVGKRLYGAAYNTCIDFKYDFNIKMTSEEYEAFENAELNFVHALCLDHPELMFVRRGYKTEYIRRSGTYNVTVHINHFDWFDEEESRKITSDVLAELRSEADRIMADFSTEYYRALLAHDYVIETAHYDRSLRDEYKAAGGDDDSGIVYTIYGLVKEHSAVCQAYALTLKYMLDYMNIPCIYVGTENHAFNIVWIDGDPTYVDSCWDDGTFVDENGVLNQEDLYISTEYFGMTTAEVQRAESHDVRESKFDLPLCTNRELRYHRWLGRYAEFYDFEAVCKMLNDQYDDGYTILEVLFGSEAELNAAYDDLFGDSKQVWNVACLKGHHITYSKDSNSLVMQIKITE